MCECAKYVNGQTIWAFCQIVCIIKMIKYLHIRTFAHLHIPNNSKKMKHVDYQTQGTCSRCIHLDLTDDGRIANVSFDGGCNGNLQGIGALVEGMKKEDVIERLQGIRCGNKCTSCPDQLATCLRSID